MGDLESAAQRLRDSVAALPEHHRTAWHREANTHIYAEQVNAWLGVATSYWAAAHIATTSSPPTVLLLADLLDEIDDECTSVLEIRRKARALASAILHTDQPEE